MPTFELPKIDFSKLDLTKLDLTKLDLSKIELPKVDFGKVEMPTFDMPKFDMPKFEMPTVEMPVIDFDGLDEKVTGLAKDAAYISIGLGVLALQKAQVRRRELVSTLSERLGATREQVEEMVKTVEKQMRDLASRLPAAA